MSTLRFTDVSAGYAASVPILHGITAEFRPGEITTIVGPNGAGKSTVLRTAFGQTKTLSGNVLVDTTEIQSLPSRRRIDLGVGFCPQGRCNFGQMTVAENLAMAGYTLPSNRTRTRAQELREQFPLLDQRWNQHVSDLSGGQQQIVEMAMALLPAPNVLLVDEPSLGLSPKAQTEVFSLLRSVADKGVCVVLVEQNVRAALDVSDHALVLDMGRVVMHEAADQVMRDDRIRDLYLGGAPRSTPPSRLEN